MPPLKKKRRGLIALAVSGLVLLMAVSGLYWRHGHRSAISSNALAQIVIRTEPSGAMVIFGDHMRRSPATFAKIEPGKYRVRMMLAGYEPAESEIVLDAGEQAAPAPIPLTRSHGSLAISSHPAGATFEIRGPDHLERSGTTPGLFKNLPTGKYDISAHEGEWQLHDAVEVQSGAMAQSRLEFATGKFAISSQPGGATVGRWTGQDQGVVAHPGVRLVRARLLHLPRVTVAG